MKVKTSARLLSVLGGSIALLACSTKPTGGTHGTPAEPVAAESNSLLSARAERGEIRDDAECTPEVSAHKQTFTFSSGSKHPTVLVMKNEYPDGGPNKFFRSFMHGSETILVLSAEVSQDGQHETMSLLLGEAFKGLHAARIVKDGATTSYEVNGRPAVFSPDGKSGTFADGSPLPRFHVEESAEKELEAIAAQVQNQGAACAAGTGHKIVGPVPAGDAGTPGEAGTPEAHGIRPFSGVGDLCKGTCDALPFTDKCSCCEDCCTISDFSTEIGVVAGLALCTAGLPVCLTLFFAAGASFVADIGDCGSLCEKGPQCCGEQCAQGVPSQNCPYPHCSDGVSCCGGFSCCDNATDCCGTSCLEGIEQGFTCRQPGNIVCDPGSGDTCGPSCCGQDRPRCRSGVGADPLCCADGAGDVCVRGTECCPASSPTCLSDRVCCNPGDILCDPAHSTSCCPQPGTCAGGQCCNPPSTVCGSQCCGPSDVCTPKRNLCCGPGFGTTVCGNDCCGPSETCLGDSCCPSSQVCNGACCPSGQTCLNGACAACGAGMVSCRATPQDPIFCCEGAQSCTPTGCCPPGQLYCGGGRCAFTCTL